MALWQGTSTRKPTGGRLIAARKKRRYEVSEEQTSTHLGATKQSIIRARSGQQNVLMP